MVGEHGTEQAARPPPQQAPLGEGAKPESKIDVQKLSAEDKIRSARALQALEREIGDMGQIKLVEDVQERIAKGEIVPIKDYNEFTPEQKQVLNAQMEAVKIRMQQEQASQKPLVEPGTKTPRGSWMQGGKKQAEKQTTHVEKPVQSST